MRFARSLAIFSVALFYAVTAHGQAQNVGPKPAEAPYYLSKYFGEYAFEGKKVIIRENGGRLEAVFNPIVYNPDIDGENAPDPEIWPLSRIDNNKYTYTFRGTFSTFIFQVDRNDASIAVLIDSDRYERNFIEPANGNTFKVSLDKPIEDYIKAALEEEPPVEDGEFREPDLVDITTVLHNVKLDVRYATNDNFLDAPTYALAKSFLHRPAAMALIDANEALNAMGYGLLVHDAYRPWYVTKIFWDATEGPERDFVANPANGSIHNRGSAIDLTLYDLATGEPIKMVGTYDEMSDRSYPYYMGGTSLERWHRQVLINAMEAVGFTVLDNEWWHFDYKDWQEYPILNLTFEELLENQ